MHSNGKRHKRVFEASSRLATIVAEIVFGDYTRKLHYYDLLWICCTDESDRRVAGHVDVVLITSRDVVDGVGLVNNAGEFTHFVSHRRGISK